MNKDYKKDMVAVFIILYMVPFLFWFNFHNSIYTRFDYYLFTIVLSLMFIIPIFIVSYLGKKWKEVL